MPLWIVLYHMGTDSRAQLTWSVSVFQVAPVWVDMLFSRETLQSISKAKMATVLKMAFTAFQLACNMQLACNWLFCFRSKSSLRVVKHPCLSNSSRTGGTRTRQKDWERLTFLVMLPKSRKYLLMLPLYTPPGPWLPSTAWRMMALARNR